MSFRPAPIPTVFVGIALFILFNLGAWQVRRHYERSGFLDSIEMKLDARPARNADIGAPFEALNWRKAVISGHFHDVPPAFLAGRYEFGEPGYDLVQPFQITDGPSVMVVRGWIPSSDWRALSDNTGLSDSEQTLQGLLIEPIDDLTVPIIPASDIAPERYRRDAFGVVRDASPIQTIPLVLIVGQQLEAGVLKSRESYPVTGYVPKPKSLPHVQYAMTWFLIAGTLIVIWLAAGIRRAAQLKAEPAPQ